MSPRWNWDSPNPSLASQCAPPPGTFHPHPSRAGEGLGESQFQRLEKKLIALCLVPTLWLVPTNSDSWVGHHLILLVDIVIFKHIIVTCAAPSRFIFKMSYKIYIIHLRVGVIKFILPGRGRTAGQDSNFQLSTRCKCTARRTNHLAIHLLNIVTLKPQSTPVYALYPRNQRGDAHTPAGEGVQGVGDPIPTTKEKA
jgi:hypothetical protein